MLADLVNAFLEVHVKFDSIALGPRRTLNGLELLITIRLLNSVRAKGGGFERRPVDFSSVLLLREQIFQLVDYN